MSEAILSLGSNLGNKIENLNSAIKLIDKIKNTNIADISGYYETEPFGTPDAQNNYINCCVKIKTDLEPVHLLDECLKIETLMGRTRPYRFAPRIIDIDLLLYENEVMNTEKLTLPHPRMRERAFVLVPMKDICKNLKFKSWNFRQDLNNCKFSKLTVKFVQNNC